MTTIIHRVRCPHLDLRSDVEPKGGTSFPCPECGRSIPVERWEQTEETFWRITDSVDDGAISHFFETRDAAEEALCKVVATDLRKDLSAPVRVTRRKLRRVR